MLKNVKNIRREHLANVIKCPRCGRVLGGVEVVDGFARVIFFCHKCGHVLADVQDYNESDR